MAGELAAAVVVVGKRSGLAGLDMVQALAATAMVQVGMELEWELAHMGREWELARMGGPYPCPNHRNLGGAIRLRLEGGLRRR
jgi:hypothetical protein